MGETWKTIETLARSRWRDLGLFLLATLAAVSFFFVVMHGEVRIAGDTPIYLEMSKGIFTGHGFRVYGQPTATYPPMYPILLGILAQTGIGTGIGLILVQAGISGGMAVGCARIADKLFSPVAGVFAGLLAATAPQTAFWSSYVLSDVLGAALVVWAVERSLEALPLRDSLARVAGSCGSIDPPATRFDAPSGLSWKVAAASAGLLGAMAALTRPLSLSLYLPAFIFMLIAARVSRVRRLKVAGLAILLAVLTVAPWAARNAVEFKGFYPLSTRNGWQLLQATQWNVEGRGTTNVDVVYPDEASGLPEGEADALVTRMAIEKITSDPVDFVRRGGLKVLFLWLPTAPGLGLGSLVMGLHFEFVTILAIAAFWIGVRRAVLLPWLMAAGGSAGVFMTILDPDYRYRLPILIALLPAAGVTSARIWQILVRRFAQSNSSDRIL